ncbi:MAG: T9SS type A sorting domain-containing protein [Saprospiraceae bacterium]|nr:T9SS type A sorting domain-containing protein [Saprospiraceae bacterium]
MKTWTFCILFIGFVCRLEAQYFQIADQTRFDNFFTATAPLPGGGFYAAAQQGYPPMVVADVVLCRYDDSGQELWRVALPGWDRGYVYDMQVLPDSSVLLCGAQTSCDAEAEDRIFLARINPDGSIRWHVYEGATTTPSPVGLYGVPMMTLDDLGRVCVLSIETMHTFDLETGMYATSYTIPAPLNWECNDLHFNVADQRFYLISTEGVERFDPLSGSLETVAGLAAPSVYYRKIVPLSGGNMLAYSESGAALEFGPDGVVTTADWSSHGVQCITRSDDGRLAIYRDGHVFVYNAQYILKHQFELTNPGIGVFAMHWENNNLLLAGFAAHALVLDYFNSSMWAQSFSVVGQTIEQTVDARLVDLINTQPPVAQQVSVPNAEFAYFSMKNAGFQVRVRNQSSEVLRELTVNASNYGYDQPVSCLSFSYFIKTFEDLDLAPGEETVLDLGLIESPYVPFYFFNPWTVCVWTSMPNGKVDDKPSNNLACLSLTPTVSSNEPESANFSLFPNPATDACTITWGENLRPETVQLFDVYGRLLLTETLDSHVGQYNLHFAALPSGVYWVVLDRAVRRLVKN